MEKTIREPTPALYPVPVVLVSCGSGPSANIITLAWAGSLCSDPPIIGIGVRPGRHSHGLILEEGAFVVNLPRADQIEKADYCGTVSGEDEDKWKACDFTASPSSQVNVPLIEECPVNIECSLRQVIPLGTHDLFLGEVVAVQVDTELLDGRGRLDTAQAQPLAYVNGEYRRVGDVIAQHGFTKR